MRLSLKWSQTLLAAQAYDRLAQATGGGDCPGLNAVIRAVVLSAPSRGFAVVGIADGFEGLINPGPSFGRCRKLTPSDVEDILARGGTILGTTNRHNPFAYRVREQDHEMVRDVSEEVLGNIQALGLDALIVVGGDGTQNLGLRFAERGLRVVGVPKTIESPGRSQRAQSTRCESGFWDTPSAAARRPRLIAS